MKKRSLLLMVAVFGMVTLFVAAGIYAETVAPDVIPMDNPAYKKHKKGIVQFSHKKHATDYKAACGECHHDADGKPLDNLKEGDNVQSCIECHKKAGELKGKKAKGKSKAEKREYHANALHDNCRDCHKAYNKKTKTKKAPTTCAKCHPKVKK